MRTLCLIAALALAPLAADANRIDSLGTHVFNTTLDNASTDTFPFDVTLQGNGGPSRWLGEQLSAAEVRLFGSNVGTADTSNTFHGIGEPILFTLDESALVRISGFAFWQPGQRDGQLTAYVCEAEPASGSCDPQVTVGPLGRSFDESALLDPGSYEFHYSIYTQVPRTELSYEVLLTIPEPGTGALLAAALLGLAARSRTVDTRKR